eukprot:1522983-Amphidinium_carterae.1
MVERRGTPGTVASCHRSLLGLECMAFRPKELHDVAISSTAEEQLGQVMINMTAEVEGTLQARKDCVW